MLTAIGDDNRRRVRYDTRLQHRRKEWTPMTYTLPDTPLAGLLYGIARDAPAGAVVIVYTKRMYTLATQQLQAYRRDDIVVRRDAPETTVHGRAA
jgi:hypothetical protein